VLFAIPRRQTEIDAALQDFVRPQENFAGLVEALHAALHGRCPCRMPINLSS
jgi:hypothetical protein